ncbi:MAG: hypothetical protein IT373_20675 [Polyangiaceae bacterium]|nr:hypothetical protein [Polyangiaceae bacterium]
MLRSGPSTLPARRWLALACVAAAAAGCRSSEPPPEACTTLCARIVGCGIVKRERDAGVELSLAQAEPTAAADRAARDACERECGTLDMARDAGTLERAVECLAGDCDDFDACLRAIRHAKPDDSAAP